MTQDEALNLILKFKNGDENALYELLEGYKPMVRSITRGYFLVGGEDEDLVQEGMIGLYKAIENYSTTQKASFSTFAYMCILRQVQTAVRKSLSKKNSGLNGFVPISDQGMVVVEGDQGQGICLLSEELNPEEALIENEQKKELTKKIKNILSNFEFEVLKLYLLGFSHAVIAQKLSKDVKSVSNAIKRTRDKLQNFFGGEQCI